MKFVDAYWDTRSLGDRCATLLFQTSDGKEDVAEAMRLSSEYDLITASVPSGSNLLPGELEAAGFRFVETKLCYEHDLKQVTLPEFEKRFLPDISIKEASEEEIRYMEEAIGNGLFATDKISLNPRFGVKVAGKRYINWISDEMEKGAHLYSFFYKDVLSGFFIYKESAPETVYPFLAALFPGKYEKILGVNLVFSCISLAKENEYRRYITDVSSNNLPIIRIIELLGMRIYDIQYIFMLDKKA